MLVCSKDSAGLSQLGSRMGLIVSSSTRGDE